VFLNLNDPAKGALIRAAASTQPLYSFALMHELKRTYRILLVGALVLVCVGSPSSQTIDPSKSQAKVNVQRTNDHGVRITTIKLDPLLIQSDEVTKAYILLSASVTYEDTSPKRKSVSLSFHSRSPSCRFSNKSNLVLILDDETMTLTSSAQKYGDSGLWVFSEPEGDRCNESCSVFISEQTFLRIIKSKNVEARLGAVTLRLGEIHLKALRDLAAHIVNGKGAV
jgi:hypothetical protein